MAVGRFQPNVTWGELAISTVRALTWPNRRGELVEVFERHFASLVGARHAVAVSSVRFGLYHTLTRLGWPPGTEVLCTPLTVFGVIETILLAGMKPVFVDFSPGTTTPDLAFAERAITSATRGFLVTHLWGVPCDMTTIRVFSDRKGLTLLEDASQCLTGRIEDRNAGTFGRVGLFSLISTKPITAYHGGVAVTDDDDLATALRDATSALPRTPRTRILAWIAGEVVFRLVTRRPIFNVFVAPLLHRALRKGRPDHLDNQSRPVTGRLAAFPNALATAFSDIQAATALRLMDRVASESERRRAVAERYFATLVNVKGMMLPVLPAGAIGDFWMYAPRVTDRAAFRRYLWDMDRIDSAVPSIDACHEMDFFPECRADLPNASAAFRETVYLPAHVFLRDEEVDLVIGGVRRAAETAKATEAER